MRFASAKVAGFQVFAVSGTNTVSFGIAASGPARKGLLGFGVERVDVEADERYFLPGFKVFASVVPSPNESTIVSTERHPIQSLVWDDFTAQPGHAYSYLFHPYKGKPKNLDRSTKPVTIDVETEPLYGESHDVFFNRGVASSQAYANKFKNTTPDKLPPVKRREALNWLSRDLDDALLTFIRSAKDGDSIHGSFYEFAYAPVLDAFRVAIQSGVDVKLVIDCKDNGGKDDGPFPRDKNLEAIFRAQIPDSAIIRREARPSAIAHNKFMVLLRGDGEDAQPSEVWTGSTNLTTGGIHGQANVGHWIRDAGVAAAFDEYWRLLKTDPGAPPKVRAPELNTAFKAAVSKLSPTPDITAIPAGTTPLFSPRPDLAPLDLYAHIFDGSKALACATFPFTLDARFSSLLADNDATGPLCFILMETAGKSGTFKLNASNNVYRAVGSEITTPLGKWVRETNTRALELNTHVAYMHCKFLLSDPLGADPIVVTGSANFSDASTRENDENMVIIRGDKRVADIYFTEFNRLFNHYYYRFIARRTARLPVGATPTDGSQYISETDEWLDKYKPGTLRSKRVAQYVGMSR